MKKMYFVAMFIISFLFVTSSNNTVQASDHYLGVYEDGREAYLMEDDIEVFEMFSRNGTPDGKEYQCTVKAVPASNPADFEYVFYSIYCSQTLGMKRNGEYLYSLKTQHAFFESHPVEKTLADYIMEIDRQRRKQ